MIVDTRAGGVRLVGRENRHDVSVIVIGKQNSHILGHVELMSAR